MYGMRIDKKSSMQMNSKHRSMQPFDLLDATFVS